MAIRLALAAIGSLAGAGAFAGYAALAAQPDAQTAEDTAVDEAKSAREQGARQCFFARNVTGFRNVDDADGNESDRSILVDVGAADTFEFRLMNRCPELRFARSIAFDQTGTGRICDGLDVDLIVPDTNLGPRRCVVTMIRKLEPGEEGARDRAKN